MKTHILFLIAICTYGLGNSQTQIKKSSIDSGGDSVNNGALSIIYSIGEVAINETLNNTLSLSEGFIGKDLFSTQTVMACTNLPSNLISWWTGDNTTNDLYGNNHGTQEGGVSYDIGVVNGAFNFDGVDDVIVVPASTNLDITGDVTVELWVRRVGYDNQHQTVLCKGGGSTTNNIPTVFEMRFEFDVTEFLFEDNNGNNVIVNGPAYQDSQWHHYAYVRQGNSHIVYADGFGFGWIPFASPPISSSGFPLTIGGRYHNPTSSANDYDNLFNGLADEVGVYNRALTATEIQSIYNAGSDGKCKNALSVAEVIDTENSIKIYPNPVTDVFTLDIMKSSSFKQGKLKLQIFNLLGKPVKTLNILNTKEQVNISTLNSGVYVYKLSDNNMSLTGKIVKR